LGLRILLGDVPAAPAIASLLIGGVLVTMGLLSSTYHLGHPERAWRAFSQWRSSWLSREGVAAVATYMPAGVLFLALVLPGGGAIAQIAGGLLALGAVATVWCTGMIYSSLRTVPEWHHGIVPVLYLTLALATGSLLIVTIDAAFGNHSVGFSALSAIALVLAGLLKWVYWRRIDGAGAPYTIAQAIGIPGAAEIRTLDPPHTQPNFVMREMGYAVARRHALRLRRWVFALLFGLPIVASSGAALAPGAALIFMIAGVLFASAGVWVERWLFFAEARHVSMLYYGASLGGMEADAS
jgi:DMSO reductase anchor subunit